MKSWIKPRRGDRKRSVRCSAAPTGLGELFVLQDPGLTRRATFYRRSAAKLCNFKTCVLGQTVRLVRQSSKRRCEYSCDVCGEDVACHDGASSGLH